jgi:transposase-like protein
VLEKDLSTLQDEAGCQNLLAPTAAALWMKQNAENWEKIAPLLRCRTRTEQEAIRNFREDPQNQNKRLKAIAQGVGYKGSDMTLLWGGCNVPVIDKQMIRYLAPHMLGKDWDSYVREQLSKRKHDGLPLRLTLRSGAGIIRSIDATEISVDNSIHRTAEEEAITGKIQSTVGRYGAWRDLAYQMADAEGIPANIWHVATWLEYRLGGDPDSPRANPRTLAQAKAFVQKTYGPSETPSAEQPGIDPDIFLPLYWGARDRGEETFIYEGQEVLVAYARYLVQYAGWPDKPEDLETPEASIDCHLEHWYHYSDEGRFADPNCKLGHWQHPADMAPRGQYPRPLPPGEQFIYEEIRQYATDHPGISPMEITEELGYAYGTVYDALTEKGPVIPFLPRGFADIREVAAANPHLGKKEISRQMEVDPSTVERALQRRPQIIMPRLPITQVEHPQEFERIRNLALNQPQHQNNVEFAEANGLSESQVATALRLEPRITYREIPIEQQPRLQLSPLQREDIRQFVAKNPEMTKGALTEIFGIKHRTLRRIIGDELYYQLPGGHGIEGEVKTEGHTPEFRAEVVQEAVDRKDLSLEEIANQYGIHRKTLTRWMAEEGVERGRGFMRQYGTRKPRGMPPAEPHIYPTSSFETPTAMMPFGAGDEGPEGMSGPFAAGVARMWDWYRRMEQDVAKQVRDGILTDAQAEREMELIVKERNQEIENLRRETGGGTWQGLDEEIARQVRRVERQFAEWQRETIEKMNAGEITAEAAAHELKELEKDKEGELETLRRELGSRPEGNIKYTDPDYTDPSRVPTPFDGLGSYADAIMELV